MIKDKQIEIPLNKFKIVLSFLASLIFVTLGIWFIINPPQNNHTLFGNPILLFITGIASIILFGLFAITAFLKFLDKKPGLIINNQGITDNSNGLSKGLILWSDIKEIKVLQVMNQKILMIVVKNPEDYLNSVTNPLKRNTMKMNYKKYGSPINISPNFLKINFNDLHQLLIKKMDEYKL